MQLALIGQIPAVGQMRELPPSALFGQQRTKQVPRTGRSQHLQQQNAQHLRRTKLGPPAASASRQQR